MSDTSTSKNVKVVEALGHTWTLGANDVASELERTALFHRAERYVFSIQKPAARSAAYELLLTFRFYKDILSAATKIDDGSAESQAMLFGLVSDPGKWVALVAPVWYSDKGAEIDLMWRAACEVNPDWYPELLAQTDEDEETSEELAQAQQFLAEAKSAVLNPDEADEEPETELVQEAAEVVMHHAEVVAKKKGRSGRRAS